MTEPGAMDVDFPLRGERLSKPFFCLGNEVFDLYVPIMGADCLTVYSFFVRSLHSNRNLKHSIDSIAESCNLSATTVSRALEVLAHLQLVKLRRFKGNRQSECQLSDAWAIAARLGARFDPKSQANRFPAEVSERLTAEVFAIRERQQGKNCGKTERAGGKVCGNRRVRVSQRNSSVSPEKRERATRETRTGTHLIRKEERIESTPTPTPTPNECGDPGDAPKDKDSPDEDEPDGLLWDARIVFTGVMNDLRNHLLDTHQRKVPHLANGKEEWDRFGFGHMAIEAAEIRGAVLVLTISAPDPAAARRGLAKYHRTWDPSIRRWFEGEVRVELVNALGKA